MASDVAEALHQALARLPHVDAESSWEDLMSTLFAAAGFKQAAAAREMGVAPTTFYRWRNWVTQSEKGIRQKPSVSKDAFVRAIRRLALPEEKRRKIIDRSLKLAAWCSVGKSDLFNKRKPARFGNYFPPGTMIPILDAWQNGDDEEAEELLRDAVYEFYEGCEVKDVTRIEFLP